LIGFGASIRDAKPPNSSSKPNGLIVCWNLMKAGSAKILSNDESAFAVGTAVPLGVVHSLEISEILGWITGEVEDRANSTHYGSSDVQWRARGEAPSASS
jgi:hypothetical protein